MNDDDNSESPARSPLMGVVLGVAGFVVTAALLTIGGLIGYSTTDRNKAEEPITTTTTEQTYIICGTIQGDPVCEEVEGLYIRTHICAIPLWDSRPTGC